MTNAIILAGTHADKSRLIYGQNKAFLERDGKPLVINSLYALKKAESIDKIMVVGPRKDLESIIMDKNIQIIEESKAPKGQKSRQNGR